MYEQVNELKNVLITGRLMQLPVPKKAGGIQIN